MMTDTVVGHRGWRNATLFIVYVAVAVVTTYPLILRIATQLPGGTTDTLVHYWNGWWVRQALRTGQSPFYTPYLFHPSGLSLVYHNFAWLNICGWLALEPLVGGLSAYNLVIVIGLGLCGWAAFLLADELTDHGWAAFLCGLIYQCWPYRMAQLDHPNLISTYAIPVSLVFVKRVLDRGGYRNGVFAGIFLALVGFTRWQLLIPASLIGGVYLASTLPRVWASRRRWLGPLLITGTVAGVALTPPALLFLHEQDVNPAIMVQESDEAAIQTDLLAYLTPSPSHPVFGALMESAYERYYDDRSAGRRFPAYVGGVALLLAVLGVRGAWPDSVPWLAGATLLSALALGIELRIGGKLYPTIPMPYHLASKSFVVRLMRFPDRFSLFLALPVSVLAAYGASRILGNLQRRAGDMAVPVACLLGGVIVFEFLAVPTPGLAPEPSSFYVSMADNGEEKAILNLPINSQSAKKYMFAQVTHQHPILQGKTARFPLETYSYLESHPLLASLRKSGEIDPALADVSRQLASLAGDEVSYVLLHKREADAQRLARWRRYLVMDPRFEDRQIVVFTTSPLAGRDFSLQGELAPGIGPIRALTSTGCLEPGGVLEVDVGWGTTEHLTRDYQVELSLRSEGGVITEQEVYPVNSTWATSGWPASTIAWGYYPLPVGESLPSGSYEIGLRLLDPDTEEGTGGSMVVGTVSVPDSGCDFPVPSGGTTVNAVFGDQLRLRGYRLDYETDKLVVSLYWRSEQRMETDYKMFVHVFDPATGVPVAQDDAMPKRWEYPTRFWMPGETVVDKMQVYLGGASPGEYGLAVGVYDPETTERLPVRDPTGVRHADERLVLPEESIQVGGQD